MEGKYDYIIKNLFKVEIDNTNIKLKVFNKEKNNNIFNIFLDNFKDLILNIEDIRFIESLLFFSMIPLHTESLEQQYAMLATAFLLLDKCNIDWRNL